MKKRTIRTSNMEFLGHFGNAAYNSCFVSKYYDKKNNQYVIGIQKGGSDNLRDYTYFKTEKKLHAFVDDLLECENYVSAEELLEVQDCILVFDLIEAIEEREREDCLCPSREEVFSREAGIEGYGIF